MITGQQKSDFINQVASLCAELAPKYDIKVISPIIAQAILESNWGTSGLATKGKNLFGIKCGSSWKGASINMQTKEEYTPGTMTNISANFRKYDSWTDSIKDYFKFCSTKRYAKLKECYTPMAYCQAIKDAGYATSSSYVNSLMNVINANDLTRFDSVKVEEPIEHKITAVIDYTDVVNAVIQGIYGDGEQRIMLLAKNGYNPLAVQFMVNQQVIINGLTEQRDKYYNLLNEIRKEIEDEV